MNTIRLAQSVSSVSFVQTRNLSLQRKKVKKHMRKRGNACVKMLKQMGWLVPEMERKISYTGYDPITFNMDDILRGVYEHLAELSHRFNIHELTLLIGSKQVYEFTRQQMNQPWSYTFQAINGHPEIAGMKLCVLPWMDGIVGVPKEYLPIKEVPTSVMIKSETEYKLETPAERELRMGNLEAQLWNDFMG